jgi:hypothetical protein
MAQVNEEEGVIHKAMRAHGQQTGKSATLSDNDTA